MNLQEAIKYVEDHLETKYATGNICYRNHRTIVPTGCVNHSVGCAQPSVDVWYNLMNKTSSWGVNALLGDFDKGEGRILLVLPMNYRPAGCGSGYNGSWNNSRIQWEIAEPAGHTYNGGTMINYDVAKNQVYFDRMWKMLVAWNVYCAHKLGYTANSINDHAESYKLGYGSNHADIGHWLPKHGKSMDILREEVAAILSGESTPEPEPALDNTPEPWAEDVINWATDEGVLKGDENGNYHLNRDITRQEALVFIYRAIQTLKNET